VQPTALFGQPLRLSAQRGENTLAITLSGEIDIDTVGPLTHALSTAALGPDQTIALDLSGVQFADASLINALLQARARWGHHRLVITSCSPCVARLLFLTGLDVTFTPRAIPGRRADS
jgi:anti-sigma B factor antagonist